MRTIVYTISWLVTYYMGIECPEHKKGCIVGHVKFKQIENHKCFIDRKEMVDFYLSHTPCRLDSIYHLGYVQEGNDSFAAFEGHPENGYVIYTKWVEPK